jgi:hypothetical protein
MDYSQQRVFADRVFAGAGDGSSAPCWFCLTREHVLGPYPDEALARMALAEFVRWCRNIGWSGDRIETVVAKGALSQLADFSEAA